MTDNHFKHKEPCPNCGSKDNLARYDDGHGYCFGCHYYEHASGESFAAPQGSPKRTLEVTGVSAAIPDRRISQGICEKYGVTVEYGTDGQISKHHYPYYDVNTKRQVGSKVRGVENKQFYATGTMEQTGLFGQQAFKEGGKFVTVTEGEADALAVSEMFDGKWPVVSIKRGAASAVKDIKESLEWLETFDNVVICFDNDEAGQKAASAVLQLFSPNKAKNCALPLKDAGDMLVANRIRDFTKEWWDAKTYRPDGIVGGADTWDLLNATKDVKSTPYPWSGLNSVTYGFRPKELVTITSGSGMGKSQIIREIEHYLLGATNDNIGILALEESVERTVSGVMSIEANMPLHLPTTECSDEDRRMYWEKTMGTNRYFMFDHWGSMGEDNLLNKIRYLAKGLDCKWIILDHLSIVVSDQAEGDERKAIDAIMTKLRALVQETGIGLFLVSHLKRPAGGKGHEDGHKVSLAELRGSAAIAQLSDMVIGLERNQQHKDPVVRNTTTVRVLKNRFAGLTGACCWLEYSADTGRMTETVEPDSYDGDEF